MLVFPNILQFYNQINDNSLNEGLKINFDRKLLGL